MDIGFSAAGLVVGIAVGATGVGGGSLMTPILILFYGINPAVAVGTDLLYASISKAFGVLLHGRNGSLDWSIVRRLSMGSVPAVALTLWVLSKVTPGPQLDHVIKLTLSIAILVTATFTLLQAPLLRLIRREGRQFQTAASAHWQMPLTVLSGAVIGSVVTVSSVGAGAIGMMLLLILYPKHAPIRIVGSDLAHAVLITGLAGLGHASMGTVNYSMLLWLLVGAVPGIYIGSRIGFKLDDKALKRLIAGLLVFVGGTMMAKAIASM